MLYLIPIAFISGILTVFSPCVLPILPLVLASGIDGDKKRVRGTIHGLVLSFTAASLLLTIILSQLGITTETLTKFVGFLLFAIGLSIIFPIWDRIQFKLEAFYLLAKSRLQGE